MLDELERAELELVPSLRALLRVLLADRLPALRLLLLDTCCCS